MRDWEDAILHAQQHLYALGITGWQDAWVTPQTFEAYRALGDDGRLTAQVVGALWWDRHRGLDQIPEFQERRERAAGTFRPTTVKIMVDGIIENQTASMLEPYCAGCGSHVPDENYGLDYVDRDLLIAALTELDALGFQVHMHAIGDRAIRNALDAVEAAQRANGSARPPPPHRTPAGDPARRPGSLRPARRRRELPDVLGADRAADGRADACPTSAPSAARCSTRSRGCGARARDWRWAATGRSPRRSARPARGRGAPRRSRAPRQRAVPADERLSLDDALTAFTSGSAYLNHDDDGGTLAIGKRADLAVLDQDVFTLDGKLADASVVATRGVRRDRVPVRLTARRN